MRNLFTAASTVFSTLALTALVAVAQTPFERCLAKCGNDYGAGACQRKCALTNAALPDGREFLDISAE